jgi:AcrR family transcriptional regulator
MNTAMQDRTKIMFAEQLETMLETMPLAKVRIVDLCKRCGTTPPTFYYYFHDKYELVAWIFLRDFADVCGDRTPEYSPEVIATILEHIERRRIFYIKAYQENSQNSINRYVQNFNVQLGKDTLKSLTGNKDISSEQLLSIKYHSYGIMGIFKEWLFGEMPISTADLARFQFEHTPDFLRDALRAYKYNRDRILNQSANTSNEDSSSQNKNF